MELSDLKAKARVYNSYSMTFVKTQSTDARDNRWRMMQNMKRNDKKDPQRTKDDVYRATGSTQLNRQDAVLSISKPLRNDMVKDRIKHNFETFKPKLS